VHAQSSLTTGNESLHKALVAGGLYQTNFHNFAQKKQPL